MSEAARMRLAMLFGATTLTCLCSCSDPESPPASVEPLMPLTLGNVWEYVEMNIAGGESTIVDTMSIQILDAVPLSHHLYFTTNSDLMFANTRDGLSVARYDHDGGFDDLEILLRYPTQTGIEYGYSSSKITSRPLRIEVRADTVYSFIGPLTALIYTVNQEPAGEFLEFGFSPRIGMISLENSFGTLWLLSAYDLQE